MTSAIPADIVSSALYRSAIPIYQTTPTPITASSQFVDRLGKYLVHCHSARIAPSVMTKNATAPYWKISAWRLSRYHSAIFFCIALALPEKKLAKIVEMTPKFIDTDRGKYDFVIVFFR